MISMDKLKTQIPADLLERIDKGRAEDKSDKSAVFDLDNTLLDGDIGDAMLLQLKIMEQDAPVTVSGRPIPLTWNQYLDLIDTKGHYEAFSRAVTAQAGIPVERINTITRQVMNMKNKYLELDGVKVPVPRPDKIMQALVAFLQHTGWEVYVISASNHYSVAAVVKTFFGIPASHVFGMKPAVTDDPEHGRVLGDTIDGPVTVGEGKAEMYRLNVGEAPPLLSAGNSSSDFEMLDLTDPRGVSIWVGNDETVYQSIKQKLRRPETAYFLHRER